jgi:hypothetical protein
VFGGRPGAGSRFRRRRRRRRRARNIERHVINARTSRNPQGYVRLAAFYFF